MTELWRVWPDGTVQEAYEIAYFWMSDDYEYVEAKDEHDAWEKARAFFQKDDR